MTIQFIWYWNRAKEIYPLWRDGLRAALEHIEKKGHTVDWVLGEEQPKEGANFILFWGDSNCPLFDTIDNYKARKGIILTTDPQNFSNLRKLDVVYCESQPVYEAVRAQGIRAIKAFGTDTDFFSPDKTVKKDIKYLCVGCFSPWKRQRDIAYLGKDLYCIGGLEPDGQEDYEAVKNAGATVEIGYFPAEHIRDLYRRAKRVIIPAIHGSERTVLEAFSMGIVPEVINPQNIRTRSYVEEYHISELPPREFVVANYSHKIYADLLLKGMEK